MCSMIEILTTWLDNDLVESNTNIYGGLFGKLYAQHTAILPYNNLIRKLQFFNYILNRGLYVFSDTTNLLEY